MAIDENYMTPNLRWGLFLQDNPGAPEPVFRMVTAEEAGVPEGFLFDESGAAVTHFVRATIRAADGRVVAEGDREIPTKEKRRTGQVVTFQRNAQNWRKLCTMALGRALKRAGYPDTTPDLKAFLLYRQRLTEIGFIQLPEGATPLALEAGSPDTPSGTIVVGGITADAESGEIRIPRPADPGADPDDDYDEDDSEGDDDVVDGEVVPNYPPELQVAIDALDDEKRDAMSMWLTAAGYTPEILTNRGSALSQAVKHAKQLAVA